MRRVILVLTDGLRPDAITPSRMPSLDTLAGSYTLAPHATTVRPSTTVAALATLATGLAPGAHGLIEPGIGFLIRLAGLRPLATELARSGIPTSIVAGELRPLERRVVAALASAAGVEKLECAGARARDVALAAIDTAARRGLVFVYFNDCDRAGHEHGWMSQPYLDAAVEVDRGIGLLSHFASDSLVLVVADHGGGGVGRTSHHEPHPVNDQIPLVLAGRGVTRRHRLTRSASLLDIPPTLCHWFGVPVPESYAGRVLFEAFSAEHRAASVDA